MVTLRIEDRVDYRCKGKTLSGIVTGVTKTRRGTALVCVGQEGKTIQGRWVQMGLCVLRYRPPARRFSR